MLIKYLFLISVLLQRNYRILHFKLFFPFQGDLSKPTVKHGSMHPLDIVKQAVQELLEGREQELCPAEKDDMKLSLARLLLCLCLKTRIQEQELAELLASFPAMGEDFLLVVVYETGLTQAFVQVCFMRIENNVFL